MDQKQYIEQRLDNQKNWYSKNSQKNQSWYKRLQIMLIVSAASIPFLAGVISDQKILNIINGALGVLIVVISGIIALNKFDEKWIKYRNTAESLKHEKYLYQTQVDPYDGAEAFSLLVKRVETLISQENSDWSQYITKTSEKKPA